MVRGPHRSPPSLPTRRSSYPPAGKHVVLYLLSRGASLFDVRLSNLQLWRLRSTVCSRAIDGDASRSERISSRRKSQESRSAPSSSTNRSEEHTSVLQSHLTIVCRLLLEQKARSHQPPL